MTEAQNIEAPNVTSIEKITDDYLYNELLRRSGGKFTGDMVTAQEFIPIYRKLHTLAEKIGSAYTEIARTYNLEPGKTEVVLGGGRAKGKPFKQDSDLDIFFYIENPNQKLDSTPFDKYPDDAIQAMEEKNIKMQTLVEKVSIVCAENNIPNHFHIMGFGEAIPPQYRNDDQLLLAHID